MSPAQGTCTAPTTQFSSSAMVPSLNIVRSSFLFVLLSALIMSHIEMSRAKSLGLAIQDDFWSQTPQLSKRNSWWSKKSSDSIPEYQKFLQEAYPLVDDKLPEETPSSTASTTDSSTGNMPLLYDCYLQSCVSDFVRCTQRSRTKSEYHDCKASHRLCALQCWVQSTEDSMAKI